MTCLEGSICNAENSIASHKPIVNKENEQKKIFARISSFYINEEEVLKTKCFRNTVLNQVKHASHLSRLGILAGPSIELVLGEPREIKVGIAENCDIKLPGYLNLIGEGAQGLQLKFVYTGELPFKIYTPKTKNVNTHLIDDDVLPDIYGRIGNEYCNDSTYYLDLSKNPDLIFLADFFDHTKLSRQALLKIEYFNIPEATFCYPRSRKFHFDEITFKIVKELEKRDFKVPGIEVELNYDGDTNTRRVYRIEGDDFKLKFCREQGFISHNVPDLAAVSELYIPRQAIHAYEDNSGNHYLYTLPDREPRSFMKVLFSSCIKSEITEEAEIEFTRFLEKKYEEIKGL